jgi:hypothetical protein
VSAGTAAKICSASACGSAANGKKSTAGASAVEPSSGAAAAMARAERPGTNTGCLRTHRERSQGAARWCVLPAAGETRLPR